MELFINAATINQPSNWPAGVAWNPQHAIAAAVLDANQFTEVRSVFTAGYTTFIIDESASANGSRAVDIFNLMGSTDIYGLNKYYADNASPQGIWERLGWQLSPHAYTPAPAQDIQITPTRSLEKAAFEDNLATILTNLTNLVSTTSTTIGQLNSDKQELARDVKILYQLFNRLFRPDS